MTLADKMRNMTDKEFAEIICQLVETVFYKAIGIPVALVDDETVSAVEELLKQEVEEPPHWTEADIALAKELKEKENAKMNDLTDKVTITRDQVEKMRGKWKIESDTLGTLISCSECDRGFYVADKYEYQRCIHQQFCELCGAPMTDGAVGILWKRLKAMQGAAN